MALYLDEPRPLHICLGCDNTSAIGWLRAGLSDIPLVLAALVVYCRFLLFAEMQISFVYVRTGDNQLADAGSRQDAAAYFEAFHSFESFHGCSIRILTRLLLHPGVRVLSVFEKRLESSERGFSAAVYSESAKKSHLSAARKLDEFFAKRARTSWPFMGSDANEYATFLASVGKIGKGGVACPLAYGTVLQYCGSYQQHALQFPSRKNPFGTPVFKLFVHRGIHRVIGTPVLKARPVVLRDLVALAAMVTKDPTAECDHIVLCTPGVSLCVAGCERHCGG
jgi:hypothetical protein